jgi:outer membrane protein OmpA-like peptidoglycan-associated protein
MKIKAPLLFFFVASLTIVSCGQHHELSGKVTDAKTDKPIQGAAVSIKIKGQPDIVLKTDSAGVYKFDTAQINLSQVYEIIASCPEKEYLARKITSADGTISKKAPFNFKLWYAEDSRVFHFPKVEYDFDRATLKETSKDSLNYLVELMKDNPTIKIQIDVHSAPIDEDNWSKHSFHMTQARAESCAHYLITQGIDSARVVPKGWGASQSFPGCSRVDIAKMKTQKEKDAAQEINRRTEFRVLSFDYKAK